jgi:Cft2 family RNA processing exonuclease
MDVDAPAATTPAPAAPAPAAPAPAAAAKPGTEKKEKEKEKEKKEEGLAFRVLYGASDEKPMSYLLKVGGASILLDCGWDATLDETLLRPLVPLLATVNLVLVSFPDLAHMGALPWVARHLRPGVPVYATHPVFKMGQMVLYDLFLSRCMETGACAAFSLDDVDAAMARFQLLKFSQPLEVRARGRLYLSITPYPAGRVLGGAFWRIQYKRAEEVLYAVDFNLKSERHLNGAIEALSALGGERREQRPSLAIVDARSALAAPADERRAEGEFLEAVTATLRKGGNVLVPVEASGRAQELLLALNAHWRGDRGLWGYKIVLLHHMARNVLHFTKSMVEWMHPEVIKAFEKTLRNPFSLKHVVAAQSMLELEAAAGEYRNPVVVLASDEGMDGGFSRALATRWASGAENALLLCQHPRKGSLAESFWRLRQLPKAALSFSVPVIERIVGEELAGLREREARERRKAAEQEEFRRQADELLAGTMGAALSEEREGHVATAEGQGPASPASPGGPASAAAPGGGGLNGTAAANGNGNGNGTGGGPVGSKRRRRRTAAMYKRPLYLVFGCRDPGRVEVDAYGEPLAEGECADAAKVTALEHRGRLQGLGLGLGRGGGMAGRGGRVGAAGGAGALVQRWGYLDGVLMTEGDARERADTDALKFVMKESIVEVRWRVKAFNLEGRTDGKSLRAVLASLAPRRLILVHGNPDALADLRRFTSKMLGGATQVSVPSDPPPPLVEEGEIEIDISEDGEEGSEQQPPSPEEGGQQQHQQQQNQQQAAQAKAAAAEEKRRAHEEAEAASVVQMRFDTKVLDVGLEDDQHAFPPFGGPLEEGAAEEGGAMGMGRPVALKEMGHYRLALVRAVASEARDADGHPLLHCEQASGKARQPFLLADGDVLLTESGQRQASLRQRLREAGVQPEFHVGPEGAALVCDGTTVVKVKDNRVSLEGLLSESYFKTREVLYSRFVAL